MKDFSSQLKRSPLCFVSIPKKLEILQTILNEKSQIKNQQAQLQPDTQKSVLKISYLKQPTFFLTIQITYIRDLWYFCFTKKIYLTINQFNLYFKNKASILIDYMTIITLTKLVMGKKTKKIEKHIEDQHPVLTQPSVYQTDKSARQIQYLIAQTLKKKFAEYIDLIDEVYNLKQNLSGENNLDQIQQKKNYLASRVQQAASVILKEQSKELEQWIVGQKMKMEQEIRKINKAYDDNRGSLIQTGSFSEQEVKQQLAHIQEKVDQKKKLYDNYNQLLIRSRLLSF